MNLSQIILVYFILLGNFTYSQYEDTLTFVDGQVLICDIKQMTEGIITVETSFSDVDFKITYDEVEEISSGREYSIYTKNNGLFNGKIKMISKPDSTKAIEIHAFERDWVTVPLIEVVYIQSVDKKFINRLRANLDFAWNWTKASNLQQLNLNTGAKYYNNNSNITFSASSVLSNQDSVADIRRTDASISYNYYFPKRTFLFSRVDFLANTEQNIELRSSTTMGAGYGIFYDYRKQAGISIGASWNNEKFTTEVERANSLEAYVEFNCELYNYSIIDMTFNYQFYPSFTELGRVRNDLNIAIKLDLIYDFYIGGNFQFNYDNRASQPSSKLDFVLQTTAGWKWDP